MRSVFELLWSAFVESFNSKPMKLATTLAGLLVVVTLMNGCGLPSGFLDGLSRDGAFSRSSRGGLADETGFDSKAFVYFSACADGTNIADRILYSSDGARVKYIRMDCADADLTVMATEIQEYQIGELSYRTHRGKSFEEESRQVPRTNLRDANTILRCHYSDALRNGEVVLLRGGRGAFSGRGGNDELQEGEGAYSMSLENLDSIRKYSIESSTFTFELETSNPLRNYQPFLARGEIRDAQGQTPVSLNCYATE